MDADFAKRLFDYKTTIAVMKVMLNDGIISKEEYNIIDTIIAEKYDFSSCSIYRKNP